ncbi:MAG: hypothetical protein HC879_20410 [Leptolyngbyaceae cyanobacterium SL_5_9]|nr:hypothetical protein [Leptolyngbyaceae cyanobacterium SL_5_9]NJO75958.1 hypothetical protein [Leptolyngbyaceae cyanobacterium RM1_406_9]
MDSGSRIDEYGIIQDAFAWVERELDRLNLSTTRIKQTIEAAWDEMELMKALTITCEF